MEFETAPTPQGSSESDDIARDEASARVHTVLPTHDSVAPDDLSDEQVVTQHLVQPAVANAANDTEYSSGDAADAIVAHSSHTTMLVILTVVLILIAAMIVAFLVYGL